MSDSDFDPHAHDIRNLSPQQWAALRRSIVARAHEERRRAIRQMGVGALEALRRGGLLARWAAGALRRAWSRHLARRKRLKELRELCAMNDLALRDIGISRPDVLAAMESDADLVPWSTAGDFEAGKPTRGEKDAESLLDRARLGA